MVDRDAMFNHMKYARDIEMPTPAVTSPPTIPLAEKAVPVKQGSFKNEASLSLSVAVASTNAERANVEPETVDHEEEKRLDERWKKKMHRAMTIISINEDDHPCWDKVDEIWREYGLTKEESLNTEQAKDYVKKYAMKELGMTTKSMGKDEQLLKDIFNDIDQNGDGNLSRDEMFTHLKRTRELEFDRKEESIDRASSDASPKAAPIIPGFANAKTSELVDQKERLIQEINTPLSLPP